MTTVCIEMSFVKRNALDIVVPIEDIETARHPGVVYDSHIFTSLRKVGILAESKLTGNRFEPPEVANTGVF
jgi:hypothetical protein